MCTLFRRNYKVYVNLRTNLRLLFWLFRVLDTEARPNFVRLDVVPSGNERMLESTVLLSVYDANNRPLRMLGQVSFVAKMSASQIELKFFVC